MNTMPCAKTVVRKKLTTLYGDGTARLFFVCYVSESNTMTVEQCRPALNVQPTAFFWHERKFGRPRFLVHISLFVRPTRLRLAMPRMTPTLRL